MNKQSGIKYSLKKLIQTAINEKTFVFKREQLSFDIQPLLTENVLVEVGTQYELSESPLFVEWFYQHYKNAFNFELTNNFIETLDFYSRVRDEFRVEGRVVMGLSERMSLLLMLLIQESDENFGPVYEEYVLSLNNEDKFLYDFNTSFYKGLSRLNINPSSLYSITRHLHDLAFLDGQYNMNLNSIRHGIQEYCKNHPEGGKELLNLHDEKEKKPVVTIHAAILSGLYQNDRKSGIKRISKLSETEIYYISIAFAISAIEPQSEVESIALLDVLDSIKSKAINYLINLPNVYVNFIGNKNVKSQKTEKRCFARLNAIMNIDDIQIKQVALRQLQFIKGHDKEVFDILDTLNETKADEKLYSFASSILCRFDDQDYFFLFLKRLPIKIKLNFKGSEFESPIYIYKRQNPSRFSENIIKLLIDDDGGIRYVGKRILSTLCISNGFRFECDILNLSAIEQYKLWMSVFQSTLEPKNLVPLLLPLRDSKFPVVVLAFIHKLEELIEKFPGSVVPVLRENLNLDSTKDQALLSRMELIYREFDMYREKKSKIKEFNPLYTQSQLLELYWEKLQERMNRIEESIEKNSMFYNFASKVKLAKGGGWKHESGGQVSQLSTISASYMFSREYFITPELYDFELRFHMQENWDNLFLEWEAAISLSESI